MKNFYLILCFNLLAHFSAQAQVSFVLDQDIEVNAVGKSYSEPWTGGLNAIQANEMDLNGDGTLDLVVFDRSNNKVSTYLLVGDDYQYAPEYETHFPKMEFWMLLRDFNCDGKPDLFTSSIFGMKVYENVSTERISWKAVADPLYTEGTSGQVNLQMNASDIPAILDMDGDGDLEILVFNFSGSGGIEYHKNYSVEQTGTCGLTLERISAQWGGLSDCGCTDFAFNSEACSTNGRISHAGGKSLLVTDVNGDLIKDLLVGQEGCRELATFINEGTNEEAVFSQVSYAYPTQEAAMTMEFPALFELTNGLVVSPGIVETGHGANYIDDILFYDKTGEELN